MSEFESLICLRVHSIAFNSESHPLFDGVHLNHKHVVVRQSRFCGWIVLEVQQALTGSRTQNAEFDGATAIVNEVALFERYEMEPLQTDLIAS